MHNNTSAAISTETSSGDWTASQVEAFLVEATWTLRRLPDKERAWLYGSTVMWPATMPGGFEGYGRGVESSLMQRRRSSPMPKEIDRYQGVLDWLQWLPDVTDRRVIFWACWHLAGIARSKDSDALPWGRVRASMGIQSGARGYSRWALKRRHASSLLFIAKILDNKEL